MTEIHVDGIGTVRHPNMWQWHRIKKVPRHNRHIAVLAFSCGMTIQQFKKLPVEQREAIRRAYGVISRPPTPEVAKRTGVGAR